MPRKRTPTDEEIEALAEQFRHLWRQDDVVRPWFRQHRGMLLGLVHGDWSWASVGQALTKAGITYRTGKPWTAKWLQSDFSRAQVPLRGCARQHDPHGLTAAEPPNPTPIASTAAAQPAPAVPRFKPASFRSPESPRPMNEAEHAEIERNRRLTFGPSDSKE
ncbi:MAG: hypothetical protein ACYCZB_03920 [Acidiphilium sp.]